MGFINQLITGGHNLVPISGLEDVPVPCWRVIKCRKTAASAEIWGSFIHSAIIKWYGSRDRSSAVMGPQRKATKRGQPVKLIKDLQRFESLTVYVWCISDLLGIYQYNSIYLFHVFLVALLELVLFESPEIMIRMGSLNHENTEWGSKSACISSFAGQFLLCRWCQRMSTSM